MCSLRRIFKYELKSCKQNKELAETNAIAKDYLSKDFVSFWSKIRQHDKTRKNCPNLLDGKKSKQEICNHWADSYEKHFSVENDSSDKVDETNLFTRLALSKEHGHSLTFMAHDIKLATNKIGLGKSTGPDKLKAEHYKYAPTNMFSSLAIFLFLFGALPFTFKNVRCKCKNNLKKERA